MKSVQVKVKRPIRVIINTSKQGNQWGKIKDAESGQVLHTGQLRHIRRMARTRYNVLTPF